MARLGLAALRKRSRKDFLKHVVVEMNNLVLRDCSESHFLLIFGRF